MQVFYEGEDDRWSVRILLLRGRGNRLRPPLSSDLARILQLSGKVVVKRMVVVESIENIRLACYMVSSPTT